MSERNNFSGGFILGAIFGGIVGGVVGSAIATNKKNKPLLKAGTREEKFSMKEAENNEDSRRSLENKIAQLNLAIDDVRQQLDTVNGNQQS